MEDHTKGFQDIKDNVSDSTGVNLLQTNQVPNLLVKDSGQLGSIPREPQMELHGNTTLVKEEVVTEYTFHKIVYKDNGEMLYDNDGKLVHDVDKFKQIPIKGSIRTKLFWDIAKVLTIMDTSEEDGGVNLKKIRDMNFDVFIIVADTLREIAAYTTDGELEYFMGVDEFEMMNFYSSFLLNNPGIINEANKYLSQKVELQKQKKKQAPSLV